MAYYLLSILLLTIIFWLLSKAKIISICPICAATLITWVLGVAGIYMSASWANTNIVMILMSASLGAVIEKYGNKLGLVWKTFMVVLGLGGIYFLIEKQVYQFLILAVLSLGMTYYFSKKKNYTEVTKKDLFKDCC